MTTTLFVYVTDKFKDKSAFIDYLNKKIARIMDEEESLECTVVWLSNCPFCTELLSYVKDKELEYRIIKVKDGEHVFNTFVEKGYVKSSVAETVFFGLPGEYHVNCNFRSTVRNLCNKVSDYDETMNMFDLYKSFTIVK